ncbi:hypothetical protein ACFV7Q_23010 [Streptomyces sp. NPDC059851]|uniref:hypothetical protein n=1 Tax=Streptomyces sp. NPDC059851 TaxID=3346971 RepID=UPI00365F457F
MTTERHLETMDQLRAREFPAERGRSDVGTSGPGYHLAELGGSRWYGDEDAADRAAHEDQVHAEYEALTQRLEERWGSPDTFSLAGLILRDVHEQVPQPWREIAETSDHLHLWRVGDRWVALYTARWGADHSPQLMAAVTVVDPP